MTRPEPGKAPSGAPLLSNVQCRSAKPREKVYKLSDSHGLYLEVRPTGGKFWRYRYEVLSNGTRRERLYSLGAYAVPPAGETEDAAQARREGRQLTLLEARMERDKIKGLVRRGLCPTQQRKSQLSVQRTASATTFALVAEEWIATRSWEEVTKTRRRQMLARVVMPHIGSLAVKSITSKQLLDLLQLAARQNGPSVAAEARRTLSGIFGHAIATLRVEHDPIRPIRGALPVNKTQHKRPLTTAEIGELLAAVAGYERNHQTVAAFGLMWLTLCRPSEAVDATWAEVDWGEALWRIPASRMKMREAHVLPLSRQAIALLRRMHGITGHRRHIFPHRDNRDQPMTEGTLRQALKQLGWAGRYSPHATRATGSTLLNEMGCNRDWIERQLAHRDKDGARSSYNQATYLKDRAVMMQTWADTLDGLREQQQAEANAAKEATTA